MVGGARLQFKKIVAFSFLMKNWFKAQRNSASANNQYFLWHCILTDDKSDFSQHYWNTVKMTWQITVVCLNHSNYIGTKCTLPELY